MRHRRLTDLTMHFDTDGAVFLPTARVGSVFLTHAAELLASPRDGIEMTDGPLWLDGRLIFSDTVEGSMWEYHDNFGLRRLLSDAGGCPGATAALHDRVVASLHEEKLRVDHTYCPFGQLFPVCTTCRVRARRTSA